MKKEMNKIKCWKCSNEKENELFKKTITLIEGSKKHEGVFYECINKIPCKNRRFEEWDLKWQRDKRNEWDEKENYWTIEQKRKLWILIFKFVSLLAIFALVVTGSTVLVLYFLRNENLLPKILYIILGILVGMCPGILVLKR